VNKKNVLVIGLGRLGTSLVEELWDTNVEITVVDKDAAAVDAVKDKTSAAFVADGSDPRVLEDIGGRDLDVAVVTYGEDFEATVLAVSTLAQLKVPVIIARAANERQAVALRAVGATRVVLVEHEMGRRLAPEILSPASSDVMEYASSFRVVPWVATAAFSGHTLVELDIRRRWEITVLGYWRGSAPVTGRKPRLAVPGPDYRVGEGDTLLLIGLGDAVEKFLDEQSRVAG
jgi:trk system potassium uptake protein TrkA